MLSRQDEVPLEKDHEYTTVVGAQCPTGDGAALLLAELVGQFDGHDAVEPVGAGEIGPIRRLPDPAKAVLPPRPESADLVGPAHRRTPRKVSSKRRSRAIRWADRRRFSRK